MTDAFFGFDGWETDIPDNVHGPLAGLSEYTGMCREVGVHEMLLVQALALALGQRIVALAGEAVMPEAAAEQVIAEAMAVVKIEVEKSLSLDRPTRLH